MSDDEAELLAERLAVSIGRHGTGWVIPGKVWDENGVETGEVNYRAVQVLVGGPIGPTIDLVAVAWDVLA